MRSMCRSIDVTAPSDSVNVIAIFRKNTEFKMRSGRDLDIPRGRSEIKKLEDCGTQSLIRKINIPAAVATAETENITSPLGESYGK